MLFLGDDEREERPTMEIACSKWLKFDDDGHLVRCWPDKKLSAAQLSKLIGKQEDAGSDWKEHKCEVIKSYGKY